MGMLTRASNPLLRQSGYSRLRVEPRRHARQLVRLGWNYAYGVSKVARGATGTGQACPRPVVVNRQARQHGTQFVAMPLPSANKLVKTRDRFS